MNVIQQSSMWVRYFLDFVQWAAPESWFYVCLTVVMSINRRWPYPWVYPSSIGDPHYVAINGPQDSCRLGSWGTLCTDRN